MGEPGKAVGAIVRQISKAGLVKHVSDFSYVNNVHVLGFHCHFQTGS